MSRIRLTKVAKPSTPAANKAEIYIDTDTKRPMVIDDTGTAVCLSDDGLRGWNAIINGEFDYAQRQTPGTLTTYSNTTGRTYGADRWGVTNENASVQFRRVDTTGTQQAGLQSRFYGEYSKLTSSGKIVVSQVIEAGNCQHFRGRTVRVQLKMKASSGKTIRVALVQNANAATVDTIAATFISAFGANTVDPTLGTNLAKIAPVAVDNATSANTGLSCSVTTSWQRFGGTFVVPTDMKNLVVVVFTDSQFAAADLLSMAEVGLYDGPEIREWVPRQQMQQLANCQRYYSKSFNSDTAPAQNAGLTGAVRGSVSVAGATAGQPIAEDFAVGMRVAPTTLTFYNPSAANAFARNTTAATDATATASANVGETGMDITFTGIAAWTVGQSVAIHYTADAEL